MGDGLKQRLIGAVVLLALAVIFVPVIFDREEVRPVDRQSQIPAAPDIEPLTLPEPEATASVEPAPPVDDMFVPEDPAAVDPATEQPEPQPQIPGPALNDQGVPQAWVLQVASFKSRDRADEMTQRLKGAGYAAFTQVVQGPQGEMTRVFVGPKLDRSRLLEEQAVIEEKFQVSTFLLRFEP